MYQWQRGLSTGLESVRTFEKEINFNIVTNMIFDLKIV